MKFRLEDGTIIVEASLEAVIIRLKSLGYNNLIFISRGFRPDEKAIKTNVVEIIPED